jgi:hypothetical protein
VIKVLGSLTLVFAAAACSSSTPVDEPRVEFSDIGFSLHLPVAMQKALDSLAPGFKTVQTASYRADIGQAAAEEGGGAQALFATIGDFDGDGAKDAVVEGVARGDAALRVIAILNGATPSAVEVTQFPEYDADAVGIYLSKPAAGTTGAFEVVNYPDASTLYRYENGAFAGTKIGG